VDTFIYRAMNGRVASADTVVTITVTPVLDAGIDIRPGSPRNPVYLRDRGVLPVAILSTQVAVGGETLDARAVNLRSLLFGDPRRAARVAPIGQKLIDLDRDGLLDLLVYFSIPAIQRAGALRADSTVAAVTGAVRTAGGTLVPFEGRDSVRVVPDPGRALLDALIRLVWELLRRRTGWDLSPRYPTPAMVALAFLRSAEDEAARWLGLSSLLVGGRRRP
jgi:hypothetical protein